VENGMHVDLECGSKHLKEISFFFFYPYLSKRDPRMLIGVGKGGCIKTPFVLRNWREKQQ
jgi:hypothetical protein